MSQIQFLLDENVGPVLAGTVKTLEPAVTVFSVGQPGGPVKQTSDEVLLQYAADFQYVLVTFDKNTMVKFAVDRMVEGKAMSGLIVIPSDRSSRQKVAEDMVLIWSLETSEDWLNRIDYLPL